MTSKKNNTPKRKKVLSKTAEEKTCKSCLELAKKKMTGFEFILKKMPRGIYFEFEELQWTGENGSHI